MNVDLTLEGESVEAWKRWMMLSYMVATLAFVLDDLEDLLEPEPLALEEFRDLFLLSLLSFFFFWHSKTLCPVLLQWVHFLELSWLLSPRF